MSLEPKGFWYTWVSVPLSVANSDPGIVRLLINGYQSKHVQFSSCSRSNGRFMAIYMKSALSAHGNNVKNLALKRKMFSSEIIDHRGPSGSVLSLRYLRKVFERELQAMFPILRKIDDIHFK